MANTRQEDGLLSPAPSQTFAAPAPIGDLPIPRSHPLRAGSSKETVLINYIDDRLLSVTRRYGKSFAADPSDRSIDSGYVSFNQVISDLDPILDVVWISATPSIQVQYLLAIAGHFRSFMHSFAFVTTSFQLAAKLDTAFSSLLSHAAGIDMTTKVRIRSLAEETRVEMINVASKSGFPAPEDAPSSDEEDETDIDDAMLDNNNDSTSPRSMSLNLAKVYEKTMEILGADLASLPPPDHAQKVPRPPVSEDVEILDL